MSQQKTSTTTSQKTQEAQIVLVQDFDYLTNRMVDITKTLFPENPNALVVFKNGLELADTLKSSPPKQQKPPSLYILDVGGCGHLSADKILSDHATYYPTHPMPTIIYLSQQRSNALLESVKLDHKYPDVTFGFSSISEIDAIHHHLYPETIPSTTVPATDGLRVFLNKTRDIKLPMTISEYCQQGDIKDLKHAKQRDIFSRLFSKEITEEEAINLARKSAMMHADMIMNGLFALNNGMKHDERFHIGTKMSAIGPAIFCIADIEKHTKNDKKPILITRQYTPELATLVSQQKIAGVMTTGTYLAAHMGLICDAYDVAGLFGHAKDLDSLTIEFDEAVKNNGHNFYPNDADISIGRRTIKAGQDIAIVNGCYDKGLVVDPLKIKALQQQAINGKTKDILNTYSQTQALNSAFHNYFGQRSFQASLNISRDDCPYLKSHNDIGLVRTEHIAQNNSEQYTALKQYILSPTPVNLTLLIEQMQISYQKIFDSREFLRHTRFRLFDLNIKEIFNQDELKEFQKIYGSIDDVKGMDALTLWPDLYEAQMNVICNLHQVERGALMRTIEVMMPSLQSGQEVQYVKNIYEKASQNRQKNCSKKHIQFGTMIENMSILKDTDMIIKLCDFVSFGTNDLTQDMTGIKRGDIMAREAYTKEHGFDPFIVATRDMLLLMKDFCNAARYHCKVSACGDHAVDIKSAVTMIACGISRFSVAPNARNLHALPTLVHYHLYDRLIAQEKTREPSNQRRKTRSRRTEPS